MLLDILIALGRLTPQDREAFVDHEIVGVSLAEIGQRSDPPVTKQAVEHRVNRARARLAIGLGALAEATL